MLITRDWLETDVFHKRRELSPSHYFLSTGTPGSNEVIVGEDNYDVNQEYSHTTLKALDVTSGETRTVHADAPRANNWWFDGQGRARVASHFIGGTTTLYWADKSGAWREIAEAPRHQMPFWPAYIDGDDTLIVTTVDATGADQFRRFDFATGKPSPDVMLATPGFDGGVRAVRDRSSSNRVAGLELSLDTKTQAWLTPAMKKIQAAADDKLAGHVNLLDCRPCDNPKVVLIHSFSATDPGSFVLYRPQTERWELVGQARPDIAVERMANLTFHRIKARDGEDLPVWVTHAARVGTPPKAGPAVVLVHGGPQVRGRTWNWDAEAQFLASRGYTVIEPEFRGSTGYGLRHERAGWKQWGQAMQDDVTDALRFAVAQGWADASRVCIMGGSYGGYSTLMGLIKDPDQYRCGIAYAAVSDPRFMYEFHWNDLGRDSRSYSLPQTLGDLKTDAAMFVANSPVEQAGRLTAPLLLVHGGVDRRVPVQNAQRMRDALRKQNKQFEYVIYDDDYHGFKFEKNKFDYYARVEAFLAKYLKP